jgi:hypothetical protein
MFFKTAVLRLQYSIIVKLCKKTNARYIILR